MRNTRTGPALLVLASLGLAACDGDPNQLSGWSQNGDPPGAGDPDAKPGDTVPPALQCTEKPQGRSYVGFDGAKLEERRLNENVGVNRARIKPHDVMAGEYQRALGLVPASLKGASGSFDAPPARWFAEAEHSGVSLDAIFDISFEGCVAFTKTAPEYAALPTPATATDVCASLMRSAWMRSPTPGDTKACVDLATTKLAAEPDARRRWTYVCASVLSSSNFLTF